MGGLRVYKTKQMSEFHLNKSTLDIETEWWIDITDYEGLYQVSNFGRIKSICRIYLNRGVQMKRKEKILTQAIDKDGYCKVGLYKAGTLRSYFVHRLLLISYQGLNADKPQVNHKNGVKSFNYLDNLEWNTCSENREHAFLNKLQIMSKGCGSHSSKQVVQLDRSGNKVKVWGSTMDIERDLGFQNSAISRCCLGNRPTAYGFKWKYKEAI